MVRPFLTILGLMAGFSLVECSAYAMTLAPEDLPKILNERNQNIHGADLLAESAEVRTGFFGRSYLPTLNFELGGERFKTGPYDTMTQPYGYAEARMNFFRGGRDLLESRARSAQARGAAAEAIKTRAQELAQARRVYWALVFQREQIRILRAALEENSRNLTSANRRIQRGLTTDTDRLEFQIQASQLHEEVESLTHQTKQTLILLRAALAIEGDEAIETIEQIPHDHDEKLLAIPLDSVRQYDLAYMKATEETARNEQALLGRWWLPTLDAYAGYYRYTLRDRDYLSNDLLVDTAAGLKLTLTLEGLESMNAARAASLRAEALGSRWVQQARDTQARFRVSQEDMKHEHELTHESERRIEQGQLYLSKTLAEYDRGVKNAPDVLGASLRLLGFRRRYSEIRRNYQLAKTELLSIVGK